MYNSDNATVSVGPPITCTGKSKTAAYNPKRLSIFTPPFFLVFIDTLYSSSGGFSQTHTPIYIYSNFRSHFSISLSTSTSFSLYTSLFCWLGAMATSFGASAASVTENAHRSSPIGHRHLLQRAGSSKVSFRLSAKPKLRFSSKSLQTGWNSSAVVKAQLNEVAVDGSSKAESATPEKSDANIPATTLATEESLSAFFTQVSDLVKLVDSNDIVELELKQLDCELVIRKKEALAPPPSAPVQYIQSQPQQAAFAPAPAPSAAPAPPAAAAAPAPKALPPPAKSSHPPFACPMAGTFYRAPAPGAPPFVQVGDTVEKGQVLCIVEAMKLMNEIESDRSGTIVEIIHQDGKPVFVGAPLFVIAP